mgnify:CR=1 FL=1
MLEMKPWYQSKTVWGALIAIAAPLLGRARTFHAHRDAGGTLSFPEGVTGRLLLQQATRDTPIVVVAFDFDPDRACGKR